MESHNQYRQALCILCSGRGTRPLSNVQVEGSQQYCIKDFSPDDHRFPCSICDSCRKKLSLCINGKSDSMVPCFDFQVKMHDFIPPLFHSCYICEIGPSRGNFGADRKKPLRGRLPSAHQPAAPPPAAVCGDCFTDLGLDTHCCSRKSRIGNTLTKSPQTLKRVAYEEIPRSDLGKWMGNGCIFWPINESCQTLIRCRISVLP